MDGSNKRWQTSFSTINSFNKIILIGIFLSMVCSIYCLNCSFSGKISMHLPLTDHRKRKKMLNVRKGEL